MSAPLAADVQTSPAQVHGAKVLHFFHSCKVLHKKIATCVRKHKWQFRQNINKTHFFQIGGLREFSRSSQGCRSVKLSILWRNKKRRNLKKTHFCIKIALKSKLSRDFVANVHFLLYLCRQNAHTTTHHIICLLCAVYGQGGERTHSPQRASYCQKNGTQHSH